MHAHGLKWFPFGDVDQIFWGSPILSKSIQTTAVLCLPFTQTMVAYPFYSLVGKLCLYKATPNPPSSVLILYSNISLLLLPLLLLLSTVSINNTRVLLVVLMELIPGLPEDLARQCLIRVSYEKLPTVAKVCRVWKDEMEDPAFLRQRKTAGCSRALVALTQARVDPNRSSGGMKCPKLAYRVTILDHETGSWSELPPVPGFSDGLPMFCQLVAVESELLMVGGWDPNTWEISNSVYIYNFVSAAWRRGADMPGVRRSFFGCATSYSGRIVYVAGGHDGDKNALRSALMYDVGKDEWAPLPDMSRERDECKGVFHRGKFHVIGGYHTEMQGRFERSAEAFDFASWQWDQVEEDFLEVAACPRTCVDGGDMGIYMCHGGEVVDRQRRRVAEMPAEVRHVACMMTWQGKLLAIGCRSIGEAHVAYTLDLKSWEWRKVEGAEEFCGHVQSGCCLEM